MWSRFTAMCNDEKQALNLCLRKEVSLLRRPRLGPGYGLHGSGLAGDGCLLSVLLASCEGSSDPQGSCRGTTGNCRRTGGERRSELQGDAPRGESQGRLRNADDLEPRMSRHSGPLAPIVYFCASTGCAETSSCLRSSRRATVALPARQSRRHGWRLRFPVGSDLRLGVRLLSRRYFAAFPAISFPALFSPSLLPPQCPASPVSRSSLPQHRQTGRSDRSTG